jgi:hypothetical protein
VPRLKLRVDFEADDPRKLLDAITAFCDEAWDRGDVVPSKESCFNTASWSYKAELLPEDP